MLINFEVDLENLVSPAFYGAHAALKKGECRELVLKGGRGSGKSSFASIEGILLLLKHPMMHGVVMRKVANTLRNSVYAQYQWAADTLGLRGRFRFSLSPLEMTYLPTGQSILFFGADDHGKLKSLKVPFGYAGFLHFEELDQFDGQEEVRSIEQSVLRGGPLCYEVKSFNPPRSRDHWANRYCLLKKPGQMICHSSYKQTPEEWLGRRFLDDAAHLKNTDYAAYEHEYLGIPNNRGGMVFENIAAREITEGEIASFDRVMNGVDFGYYPDPWAFVRAQYHSARRELILFDEAVAVKKGNRETADIIRSRIEPGDIVVCDSAEPKSVDDYRAAGIRARGAQKGPGSVEYSMKWLQSLSAIVIDKNRCPNALREFMGCEYERGPDGAVQSGYPDRENHLIDAVRYATERIWRRRGR